MVEKLNPAFDRCQYCGGVFFRTDGKKSKIGFLCDFCAGKGVILNGR